MTITMQENNDVFLLDLLKKGFELKTDADLAAFLGITRGAIYTVRHKTGRLGPVAKIRVLDKVGFLGIRNLVEKLTSSYISNRLHELSVNQAANIISKKLAKQKYYSNDETELPDRIRVAFNIKSDQELGSFLGINRNSVSMVRSGKAKFGIGPKLRILQQIDNFDYSSVFKILEDSEWFNKEVILFTTSKSKLNI